MVTVIKGPNGAGKSCIIKSILSCLGAEPEEVAPEWLELDVKCWLHFSVSGRRYSIFQDIASRTVLDADGRVLLVNRNDDASLARFWADTCDFRLEASGTNGQTTVAHQANYFLPYYIDQDTGWSQTWGSFSRSENGFVNRKDVLEYHVGITSNDFYSARAQVRRLQDALTEPVARSATLQSLVRDVGGRFDVGQFSLDIKEYQKEVDELLGECENLREIEETYKEDMISLQERKLIADDQLRIAQESLHDVQQDYQYASTADEGLECPVCGAHYENSFEARFQLARDEDQLRDTVSAIRSESARIVEAISRRQQKLDQSRAELAKIELLLATRQGALGFGDVIRSAGRKEVLSLLRGELEELNKSISAGNQNLDDAKKQLRSTVREERRKQIIIEYQELMKKFIGVLATWFLAGEATKQIDARIGGTGSQKPRAILTYRWALLHLIHKRTSAAFCPIIIDAPNQQDQDMVSRRRMMTLLAKHAPNDAQIIVGLVNSAGVKLPGTLFALEGRSSVLVEKEYLLLSEHFRKLQNLRTAFEQLE